MHREDLPVADETGSRLAVTTAPMSGSWPCRRRTHRSTQSSSMKPFRAHDLPPTPPSPAGLRLQRTLLSISRQAERDLQLLPRGDAHWHVHALRVRMKKLRAVLQLMKAALARSTARAIRHHVRVMKRSFARSRDSHVLQGLLAELGKEDGPGPDHPVCAPAPNDHGGMPGPDALGRLQAAAHKLTHLLQTMQVQPLAWDDVATSYAGRYAKARRCFRRCGRRPSTSRLHRWRAPVKDHYFQSVLLLHDRAHLSATRELASLLGELHDLAMLRKSHKQPASRPLERTARRRMKHLRRRAFRTAREVFVSSPDKIARQVRAGVLKRTVTHPLVRAQNGGRRRHRRRSTAAHCMASFVPNSLSNLTRRHHARQI